MLWHQQGGEATMSKKLPPIFTHGHMRHKAPVLFWMLTPCGAPLGIPCGSPVLAGAWRTALPRHRSPATHFSRACPIRNPHSHLPVPSQQEIPGSEAPRARAPRPDMPVYTGLKIRRSVTPEYCPTPGVLSGGPFRALRAAPQEPLGECGMLL